MMKRDKSKIKNYLGRMKYYDWLVVLALLFILGAHNITNVVMGMHTDVATNVAQAEAVVQVFEAAPIAKYVLVTAQLKYVFSLILTPAIILGSYVLLRRKLNKNDAYGAEHIAWIFLFVGFTDFLNDLSVLLGLLL